MLVRQQKPKDVSRTRNTVTNSDLQKEQECSWLRQVLRAVDGHDPSDVQLSEEPDFLMPGADRRVLGIELTRIHKPVQTESGRPLRAAEGELDAIVDRAQEIAPDKGVSPLQLRVYFAGQQDSPKARRESIACGIAEAIVHFAPRSGDSRQLINWTAGKKTLPEEVGSISMFGLRPSSRPCWSRSVSGYVMHDFGKNLQSCLDKKQARLSRYLEKCDRCWLIVVAEGVGEASFLEPSTTVQRRVYESAFERVFFLDAFSGTHFELDVQNRHGMEDAPSLPT